MKIEIGKDFPKYFKPSYPEEFELFSHFEVTAGIPTVLFAITTWKENGKPNVCFHSWSCFHGDKTAFFAVMGNLYQHTHTYANIQREKCFCINFLPISYYDKLVDTINHNDIETDEFAVGSFTLSNAKTIHAPAIQEAFINMECTLKYSSQVIFVFGYLQTKIKQYVSLISTATVKFYNHIFRFTRHNQFIVTAYCLWRLNLINSTIWD